MGDKPKLVEQEFYYPQHTVPERVNTEGAVYGGPYLDDVQRLEAEKQRAVVEGREPDLENPSAIAGTPLLTAQQINGDGLVGGAVPDQVLPVSVGDPETDDDGNPTGNKGYLKVKSKKKSVSPADRTKKAAADKVKKTEKTRKEAAKKAEAAPITSK